MTGERDGTVDLILAASAGELGVEDDAVADIADDEEGRAALLRRQGGDVAACLVVGAFKGFIKGGGAALAMAGLGGVGLGGEFVGGIGGEALLGFVDEVARLVEVDEIRGAGAIWVGAGDGAVEDVEVLRGIGLGGGRARDAEDVAEFGEEHLVVCPLGSAGG